MMKSTKSRFLLSLAVLGWIALPAGAQTSDELKFGTPVKLGGDINSVAEENNPHVSADGSTLYFVRTFHPDNTGGEDSGQDIWYSTLDGTRWSPPQNNLGDLNNVENNAVAGTNLDGNIIYLLHSYGTNRKLNRGLAFSYNDNNSGWQKPKRVKIPKISRKHDHQGYYVNRSGDVMVVSMMGPDSNGEEDLYVSRKNAKGKWDEPIHLGENLNTKGFEISPYLSDDGTRLYFASDGHGGMGDSDIFYTIRLDDSWTSWSPPKPVEGVNSKGFDAYFFIGTNDQAYFSSNRDSELSDLYSVKVIRPAAKTAITGVFEYDGLPSAGTKLTLVDENDNVVATAITDEEGGFVFRELTPDGNYRIKTDGKAYDDGELYLVNDEGEKVAVADVREEAYTFNSLDEDRVNGLPPIVEAEDPSTIAGVFEFNDLPAKDVTLELLDENDNVIGTAVTDEEGNFVFNQLNPDTPYFVRVAEKDAAFQPGSEIYFIDDNGNRGVTPEAIGDDPGTFAFIPTAKPVTTVAVVDPKDPVIPDPDPKDPVDPKDPDPVKPDPVKPDPVKPDPVKPDPVKPDPVKPDPVSYAASDATKIIYFSFNSYNLTRETRFQCYQLLAGLEANPNSKLLIEGHTDNVGSDKVNDRFAEVRAKSVTDYFISRGIAKERITSRHHGMDKPAASNDTREGRAKNRRVEITIK